MGNMSYFKHVHDHNFKSIPCNTICKIDPQPYIYTNFEPQLHSFHAIGALKKPLSRLSCFTYPIFKPLRYECVFMSANNFQRFT